MLDYSKNMGPLYLQIKEYIKKQLTDKTYDVGDILPSELEYQKQFGVSRITVRNAINELVNEGYLKRTRGKGTVVLFRKVTENISRTRSFSEELSERGLVARTRLVNVAVVKADSLIAGHLGIQKDEYVLNIQRIRGTDSYPILYADSYFGLDRGLPVDKDLYYGSLYETIQRYCGIDWKKSISRYSDQFEAVAADRDLSDKLEISPGMPVLKRLSKTCDQDGRIFEFTICYYRGDKFSCSISFREQ